MFIKVKILLAFFLTLPFALSGCGDNAALRLESIVPPVKVNVHANANIGSQQMQSASGYKMSAGARNISAATKSCNTGGYCMQIGISR